MKNRILLYFLLFIFSFIKGEAYSQVDSTLFYHYIDKSTQYKISNLDSALYYAHQALLLVGDEGDDQQKAIANYQVAVINRKKGNYDNAFKNGFEALSYYEKAKNTKGIISAKTLIGSCYSLTMDNENAKKYFTSAINLGNEFDQFKTTSYIGLGNVLYYQDSIEKAEKIYQNAIQLIEKNGETSGTLTAGLFINLGNIQYTKDNLEAAKDFYLEGYRMYDKINSKIGLCISAFNIGDVYYKLGNYEESEKYYLITLNLGKEVNSIDDITYALQGLSDLYKTKNDYKNALKYMEEYHDFADSISKIQHNSIVNNLQLEYEHEKNEIKLQKQDKLIRQAKIEKIKDDLYKRLLIFGIGGLAILAAISLFSYLKIKKKNHIIEHSKIELDKTLKEKDVLLKEIHHRVKNNLQMISSLLNLQTYSLSSKDAIRALEESKNRVQAMALVHKKLYQNTKISNINLEEYIYDLSTWMGQVDSANKELNFELKIEQLELNIDTIVPLGLIICELISNSQKHAFEEVSNPYINIKVFSISNNTYRLEYFDNGKGLPEDFSIENLNSLGFEIIESLTEQLDGNLTIGAKHGFNVILEFQKI